MKGDNIMKKTICVFVIMLLLVGCSGIQFSKDTTTDQAYKIGKMAGVFVAVAEPQYVAVALPYAEGLLKIAKSGEITNDQMTTAVNMLADRFGADQKYKGIATLFMMEFATVKIETGKVNEKLILLIDGFVAGCKLTQGGV